MQLELLSRTTLLINISIVSEERDLDIILISPMKKLDGEWVIIPKIEVLQHELLSSLVINQGKDHQELSGLIGLQCDD